MTTNPRVLAAGKTYARAFVSIVLAAFLADGADVFAVSVTDLKTWLAAGLGAAGAVALKAVDSSESDYGRGSVKPVDDSDTGA